jgi:C-terminal processing protease CtpA/Prc
MAVFHSPIAVSGFVGPESADEGVALFKQFKAFSAMRVGSADHDPNLPVALLLHRDGSASDFMPLGMKGASKVRIFAPHATAGAFSTYYHLQYWGGISLQLASGDAIAADGRALLGHGVQPDVVVEHTQSDLLAGRDALHEAALAWVRQELKP